MPSPVDVVRQRLVDQLTSELADASLADQIVERLDQRATAYLADSPTVLEGELLSYAAGIEPEPEVLVVFAFGNRRDAEGLVLPGPVNLELAQLADQWAQSTGLPVIAQWEVADEMQSPSTRVGAVELDDGSMEYLSTAGVSEQVRGLVDAERVAVLAMADHAVRCCRTLERVGFAAGVPEGVDLPSTYDPASGQPWTRDRASYIAIDILARCLTSA